MKHPPKSNGLSASRLVAIAITCLLPSALFAEVDQEGIPNVYPRKKLIAAGWDSPSPSLLLENLEAMEKTPFDGVRVQIVVKNDEGKDVSTRTSFRAESWNREWFREEIEKLQRVKSRKLTDNFLTVGPGSKVDWFDDEAWQQVVDHLRTAAWIAREGGLKGVFFDSEIGTSLPAFSYNRQLAKDKYGFAQYAAKVRQRGREAMRAMAQEYPDMVLFTTFLNGGQGHSPFYTTTGHGGRRSHFYVAGDEVKPAGPTGPLEVQEQQAPLEKIEGGSYSLLPAFVNGWLDAIPAEMTIVDGLEQTYTVTDRSRFLYWSNSVRNTALPLVAPENRRKYRGQVRVAFGIYLDPYVNAPDNRYYIGASANETERSEKPRVRRLEESVRHAMELTDEYVWLWGEKYRWWPTDQKRVKPESWDDIAPGMSKALRNAADPSLALKSALKAYNERFTRQAEDERVNLVKDGSFQGGAPEGWIASEGTLGTLTIDPAVGRKQPGALSLRAAGESVYYQEIPVPKGNGSSGFYGIRAWVRQTGDGEPRIRIRWKNAKGRYLLTQSDNIFLAPESTSEDSDWKLIRGGVIVPPDITTMVVQLLAPKEQTADGNLWFDDIGVYKIN